MINVTYVEYNGARHNVTVAEGSTLMSGAVDHGIPGIDATCGGACTCGTCHVFIDGAWADLVGGPSADEEAMLEFKDDVQANSRLACQVILTPGLDGIVVRMPENQEG